MRVNVLGPLLITDASGAVIPAPGRTSSAVLVLLALARGRSVPADDLIDAIWGETLPASPGAALQVGVSKLRRAMGAGAPVVERTGAGYRLRAEDVAVDLWVAEALMAEGRSQHQAGLFGQAAEALGQARGLWRGTPLLEQVTMPFRPAASRRLEELHLSIAEAHQDALLAAGRPEEVLALVRELVAAHPWRERLREQELEALARSGRTVEALRTYENYRVRLADELGVSPGPQLQRTHQRVLQGPQEPGPSPSVPGPRLVGRDAELHRLERAWGDASNGRFVLVEITGEPGIGKSATASELVRRLRADGVHVLRGACGTGPMVAHEPWAGIVHDWSRRSFAEWPPTSSMLAEGVLAWLAPPGVPGERTGPPALGAGDLEWLASALASWLQARAAHRPVLLMIEDLDRASPGGMTLTGQVLSRLTAPLLVLTTSRQPLLSADRPVSVLVDPSSRQGSAAEVHLRGLDAAATFDLLEELAGHGLGAEGRLLANRLVEHTGGNPLFIVETVRLLAEQGLLMKREGRWTLPGTTDALPLPETAKSLIAARLGRLGGTQGLLRLASAIGSEFSVDLLAEAAGLSTVETLAELESAVRSGLVQSARPGVFRFTHGLAHDVLAGQEPGPVRTADHLRVAAVLLSRPGGRWAEIAHHYLAAGAPETAGACCRSAEEALAVGAVEDALVWVQRGLDHAEGKDAVRCDLLTVKAEAGRRRGDPDVADTQARAVALATKIGDGDRLARAVLTTSWMWPASAGGVDQRQVRFLEEALRRTEDVDLRCRLLAALATELVFDPDWRRRHVLADEALATARLSGRVDTLVAVLNRRFHAIWTPHTLETRRADMAEATGLSSVVDPTEACASAWYAAASALEAADRAAVDRWSAEALNRAHAIGHPVYVWGAHMHSSWLAVLDGDLEGARRLSVQARDYGVAHGVAQATILHAVQRFGMAFLTGGLHEVRADLEATKAALPGMGYLRALLAAAQAEAGLMAEARSGLTAERLAGFPVPRDSLHLCSLVAWAAVAAKTDDTDAALVLVELLEPWAEHVAFSGSFILGVGAASLRRLSRLLGDPAAERMWQAAVRRVESRLGLPTDFGLAAEAHRALNG